MKNRWQPVLFLVLSLTLGVLFAPRKAAPELRSKLDSYSMTVESIVFTLPNPGSESITCSPHGMGGWFEVQTDSGWEKRASLPDRVFYSDAILLFPGGEGEIHIWMDNFRDDSWTPGTYRFVLPYHAELPTGTRAEAVLTSNEFTLT